MNNILFMVVGFKLTFARTQFYIFQVMYVVVSLDRSSDVVQFSQRVGLGSVWKYS